MALNTLSFMHLQIIYRLMIKRLLPYLLNSFHIHSKKSIVDNELLHDIKNTVWARIPKHTYGFTFQKRWMIVLSWLEHNGQFESNWTFLDTRLHLVGKIGTQTIGWFASTKILSSLLVNLPRTPVQTRLKISQNQINFITHAIRNLKNRHNINMNSLCHSFYKNLVSSHREIFFASTPVICSKL